MLTVQIDENEVRKMYLEQMKEKIAEVDAELVFWDRKELLRKTCMCWNSIQKEFFYDTRFPKYKIGSKWYFPAKETREFLLQWLSEKNK